MKEFGISGYIGWDTTADSVREFLREAKGEDVRATISTSGGLVSEGIDIYNQFRNYPGKTIAVLSGYAMSMGSYIPMAFDEVYAEDNAIYMIHNVHGGIWGDHNDILDYGEFCKGVSGLLSRAYVKKSGQEEGEIEAMMDKETYLFGEEIVEMGFADTLVDSSTDENKTTAMAAARLAFESCSAKLNQEAEAVKKDLRLAARMTAMVDLTNHKPGSPNVSEPAKTGDKIMALTLETLKADHSDLVAALVAESTKGMIRKADAEEAQATAVKAEGESIMALVTASVGEDAAKKITMAHSKGLSADDLAEMGVTLSVVAEGNTTEGQMLAAITAAASKGVGAGSGGRQESQAASIDTAGVYASRQEQVASAGR